MSRISLLEGLRRSSVALFLLLVFGGQFVLALGYPEEPRLFPLIVGAFGIAMSLALLFGFGHTEQARAASASSPMPLVPLLAPVVFATGLLILGFWVTLALCVPALIALLGERRPMILAVATLAVIAMTWGMFRLIRAEVPAGVLWSALP